MKRKILVTGGSGLIGSYFHSLYSKKFKKDIIISPSHSQMDITNLDSVRKYFDDHMPDVVIHFAAFRDATQAEKQRGDKENSVWMVNVEGSNNIAKVCKEYNSYLVHISTDYVFAGHKKNPGPYSEKDEPSDDSRLLSWYGVTKREAERKVMEKWNKTAVIRICNITRPGNDPKMDYIGKILWLYKQNKIYSMFDDQFLSLTYIPMLSELIFKLIELRKGGVFHASTSDICTPHELANYLIEKFDNIPSKIERISIDYFLKNNPRRYPKFGGLTTKYMKKILGLEPAPWREIADLYIEHLKNKIR